MKKDRNQDGIPMKDALQHYFKAIGLEDKLHETRVLSAWEEMMGSAVSKRTTEIYIKEKTLYLTINSSVMRDDLHQQKDGIITKVNTRAGYQLIDDIFLK